MIAPAAILSRLRAAAMPRPKDDRRDMPILMNGQRVGRVQPEKDGFAVEVSVANDAELGVLLDAVRAMILTARSGAGQ